MSITSPTGFGKWLLNFPELLRWLSLATLWLECWGPFLLFIPFFTARIRTLVILAFIGFHFGIFLCMDVGLFSWVSIVGWTVFLPGSVWDWLGKTVPITGSAEIRRLKNRGDKQCLC